MKALVVVSDKIAGIQDVPMPQVRDEWVLVKVKAVALNPADHKGIDYGGANVGSRLGCDYAGVVEEVGSAVTKFKKGDRIAGAVRGGDRLNHDNGAWGEYLVSKACIQLKTPDNITDEQAATLGVATLTVGQGMYKWMNLPLPTTTPTNESFPILIYGGSTATGVAGIQYAKASGLFVIATCSPHNFEYLKSLGADAVFDYHSPTCAEDIKKLTNNRLTHVWDCLSADTKLCATAMSDSEPGIYGTINPAKGEKDILAETNPMINGPQLTIGYEAFGDEYFFLGNRITPDPSEMEFASNFIDLAQQLLTTGTVKPITPTINKGGNGLDGILHGLNELRSGNVSGTKLVYTL